MRHALPFLLALAASAVAVAQGVDYTADDVNPPYAGRFRPGVNLAYVPPWGNLELGNLAAGNPALGIPGIGARTTRPGLFDIVLNRFGRDLSVDDYEHFRSLGMEELTAIVGFPDDENRDYVNKYCNTSVPFDEVKWNAHFRGLYEPIWDGGANGTPYNDDNLYAAYLYEVVALYTPYVRFWEIWNEPGLYKGDPAESQKFWGGPEYPGSWWVNDPDPCDYVMHAPIEHYVRVLRISYEVIKSISPDDYVAIAGVGSQSFLDAILRNTDNPGAADPVYGDAGLGIGVGEDGSVSPAFPKRAGAYVDVLGFHTYPHFDGSTSFAPEGFFERHSDGAADGVIERRLGGYQAVLEKYGYDGVTYPKKQHIATEINVPRAIFSGEYFGGEREQVNFIQKVLMELKRAGVHQMHVFTIGDAETEADADFEFDVMGLYKKLEGVQPYNQVVNEEGVAYKTAADLITPTEYDASATAALRAPDGVRAYAWALPDGEYVYALWAETRTDLSEDASATYTFPAALGLGTLRRHAWDFSRTGDVAVVDASGGLTVDLDATPVYFVTDGGVDAGAAAPSVTLASSTPATDRPFTVDVSFTEPVTGLAAGDFAVLNGVATALTGSGAAYTLTVAPAEVTGDVSVALPAGAAVDADGEASLASNVVTVRNLTGGNPGGGGGEAAADLSLALAASADVVERFGNVTYTVTLANAGPDAATGVTVGFALPDSLNFVEASASRGAFDPPGGSWNVGAVAAGATETLAVTLFANTRAERRAFAQVTASGVDDPDSTPANGTADRADEDDEAAYVINVGRGGGSGGDGGGDDEPLADLSLALAAADAAFSPEGRARLTATVTNAGPDAADGVAVRVVAPAGTGVVSASPSAGTQYAGGAWTVNRLAPGASATLDVVLFADDPSRAASVRTQVSASSAGDPDSTPGNDAAGEDDDATATVAGAAPATSPDVELAVAADRATVARGGRVTFTTTLTNAGDAPARGLVVHAPVPVGAGYREHAASAGSLRLLFDRWSIGTLAPGASATLAVTVEALRADLDVVGFAQVLEQSGRDADSAPGNRACCTPVEDDEAVARVRPNLLTRRPVRSVSAEGFAGRGSAAAGGPGVAPERPTHIRFHGLRQSPRSGGVVAAFTTAAAAPTRGLVVDALGRVVRRLALAEGPGDHRVALDTAGLDPGPYTLLVDAGGAPVPVRLVVSR